MDTTTSKGSSMKVEEYMHYLDEAGLTKEEKEEYIARIWKIMESFVDQAFEIDTVSLVNAEKDRENDGVSMADTQINLQSLN